MIILTHLLLSMITILACKWPNGRRVFLPTIKTFEGICIAIVGQFLQKELWILFVFETMAVKKTIKFSFKLIYEHVRQIKYCNN